MKIICRLWSVVLLLASLNIGALGEEGGAVSVSLSKDRVLGERYMGIRLLGNLRLPNTPVNGRRPGGLSGLAWDEDEHLLYAISDNAQLFHLRPIFQDGLLHDVRILTAYSLQDAKGRPLKSPWADSEGLTLVNGDNGRLGDSRLLVSFEVRPRIRRYTSTGKRLGGPSLPAALRGVKRYAGSNAALEALTLHKRWGLLAAPERPLRGGQAGQIPIFAMDGRSWRYALHRAENSALVAMEALPDGSLLTLERAYVSLLRPLVISLRRTRLMGSTKVDDVAVFDSSRGWLLDNFEGLSRHQGRRFFMISDDNRNMFQSTLLVYFELLEAVE